jgi:dimethylargininase
MNASTRFTRAVVRIPGSNFSQGLTTATFQSGPDFGKALEQHTAYCDALRVCGVEVTVMPPDKNHPDGTFVEDTFVIADGVAVATRPGAKSRAGEVAAVAATLQQFRPQLESIEAPGTLDGGDVCQVDRHFLIGISLRTNQSGAEQLAAILARHGYSASMVDIRSHASLLHLKSGIAYLGDDRFLAAPGFPDIAEIARYDRIEVAPAEAYGANCIRVNDEVFIAAGHPQVAAVLAKLNYQIRALEMSEFAKMDGGLSCLSLRF